MGARAHVTDGHRQAYADRSGRQRVACRLALASPAGGCPCQSRYGDLSRSEARRCMMLDWRIPSGHACSQVSTGLGMWIGGDLRSTMLDIMTVVMRMTKARITHSHQLHEEEHKDRHQRNAFWPWVVGDHACQAFLPERLICGSQKLRSQISKPPSKKPPPSHTHMYERRRNNDSGAEVFRYEEGPSWNPDALVSRRKDREPGSEERSHQDHKDGGYSHA